MMWVYRFCAMRAKRMTDDIEFSASMYRIKGTDVGVSMADLITEVRGQSRHPPLPAGKSGVHYISHILVKSCSRARWSTRKATTRWRVRPCASPAR